MRSSDATLNAKGRFLSPGWLAAVAAAAPAFGQTIPIIGETYAHDPSPIVDDNGTYFYYSTGQGILSRESTDLSHWSDGPAVFGTNPAWTTAGVPGFTGDYWAPQVNYFDGQYHLYYAVSTSGSQVSGIGMATSPTLNPAVAGYGWSDQGPVIQSTTRGLYNAIDPSVITAPNGTMWMSFGSYWQGIYEVQLNPATGLQLNPGTAPIHLSIHLDGLQDNEASYLYYRSGYYYLFENWGSCCSGTASTYNVRMGRSTSVNGPFVDEAGVSLLNGGGSLFLGGTGNYIGPGQVGIYSQNGADYLSYHYYNGANNGTPALGIQTLHWTAAGWPTVNNALTWSASTTGTVTDGGGTWDLTSSHFVSGSTAQPWDDSGYGAVTFGSQAGPAGLINVTQPTVVQTITFNAASSGSYTLAGSSAIALPVYATITSNVAATIATPITAGQLTTTGLGTLTLAGPSTVTTLLVKQGTLAFTGIGSLTTAANPVSTNDNYASIGQSAGDSATVTMSGSSTLTVAGDLNVADTGAVGSAVVGVLNVGNGAMVNARTLFVGKYSDAIGTVNQTGGTVQEADNGAGPGDWRIGGAGSTSDAIAVGVYNLSGGTLNPGRANFQVGAYGSGTITQTGGTVITGSGGGGYLSIGRFPGSTGVYNLSAGNGTLNENGGPPAMIVGEQGTGTLLVGGSSVVNANGLSIGHNNGGVGTVLQAGGTISLGSTGVQFGPAATATGGAAAVGIFNLSGGTLITPTIVQNTAAPVTGTLLLNGGTLRASAGGTLVPIGLSHAYVSAGGALIDTATNTTTVAAVLAHDPSMGVTADGGLTKLGTGTLILSGKETYTGPTMVSAGTLRLQPAPSAPVTGALAWFDAADTSTVTTTGGIVTAWTDKGSAGAGLNAADGVAGQGPNLTTVNGLTAFSFNASSGLVTASNIAISGTQDRTLFVVGGRGTSSMFLAHEGPVGQTNLAYGISSETANSYGYTWSNDATFGIQPSGLIEEFDSELSGNGTALSGDLTNAGVVTTDNVTVAANTGSSALYLGYRPGAVSTGTLAEVIEYPTALTSTQRAQVQAYLDAKWLGIGFISNGLPAGSPMTVAAGATLDLNGTNQTVASLAGPAGAAVTLGAGNLTFNTAGASKFGGIISGTGGVVMNGPGTQTLGGSDTYAGSTAVNSGTLNLGLNSTGVRTTAGIAVAAGAALVTGPVGSGHTLLVTPTLSIAGSIGHWTGSVDLAGNELDMSGATLAIVNDQVRQGYALSAGAGWTGPGGITSSTAAADTWHLTAVGVIRNNQDGTAIYTAAHPFDTVTPGIGDVLVKYTWFGDANLDGKVDGSDYALIDAGYASHGSQTGWLNGDFNYDGVVDGSDYALIDNAFNNQGSTPAAAASEPTTLVAGAASAVPEPSILGAIAAAAALSLARRRRD
jgi:autotransporter-associated beta strand protein